MVMIKIIEWHKEFLNWIKHMLWLLKQALGNFILGNYKDAEEALYLLKIHLCYEGKRIK
jgi:hypothetical protein